MTTKRLLLFAACCLFAFAAPAAAQSSIELCAALHDTTSPVCHAACVYLSTNYDDVCAREWRIAEQRSPAIGDPCLGACPGCGGVKCGDGAAEQHVVRNSVFTQELADQCAGGEYNCRTWIAPAHRGSKPVVKKGSNR